MARFMAPRTPKFRAVVCVVCLIAFQPLRSMAQSREATDAVRHVSSPPIVQVTVVDDACDMAALYAKTQSWLASSVTTLRMRREPRLEPSVVMAPGVTPGVRVWVVFNSGKASLYFVVQPESGRLPRYLFEEVELDGGFDELGLEQLAQALYLSSQAIWDGQIQAARHTFEARLYQESASVAARNAEPAWSEPSNARFTHDQKAAPQRRLDRPTFHLHSELGYGLRLRGPEGMVHGPQMSVRAGFGAHDETSARITIQLCLPSSVNAGPVVLDFRGYSMRGALHVLRRTGDIGIAMELGPGLDIIRYSAASSAEGDLQLTPSRWELRPMLWFGIGVETTGGPPSLSLHTSLALQLTKTHYDLVDGPLSDTLMTPWIIQPGASVQIVY